MSSQYGREGGGGGISSYLKVGPERVDEPRARVDLHAERGSERVRGEAEPRREVPAVQRHLDLGRARAVRAGEGELDGSARPVGSHPLEHALGERFGQPQLDLVASVRLVRGEGRGVSD